MSDPLSQKIAGFIPRSIDRNQAKDTGMAMVLICLLVGVIGNKSVFITLAIPLLVINMIFPSVYRPVAKIWLSLSFLLGTVMSRLLLSIMFFILVTPVGLIRRIVGADSLKLKKWKKESTSVFKVRDHLFESEEIEKPY